MCFRYEVGRHYMRFNMADNARVFLTTCAETYQSVVKNGTDCQRISLHWARALWLVPEAYRLLGNIPARTRELDVCFFAHPLILRFRPD